jgi:hypothetical protein
LPFQNHPAESFASGCIADWPALYAQVYEHLAPGGYFHQLEPSIQFKSDDGSLLPDHVLSQWSDVFHEASEKFGKPFRDVWSLGKWIREAGFEDLHETWYKLPTRGWASDPHMKELGRWNLVRLSFIFALCLGKGRGDVGLGCDADFVGCSAIVHRAPKAGRSSC